jgi:hypothetical protein
LLFLFFPFRLFKVSIFTGMTPEMPWGKGTAAVVVLDVTVAAAAAVEEVEVDEGREGTVTVLEVPAGRAGTEGGEGGEEGRVKGGRKEIER